MSEDKQLKALFDAMKQKDLQTESVPDFDSLRLNRPKRSLKPWMYAAAAAAILLMGWFALFQSPDSTGFEEDFSVSLDLIEDEQTDPLLADTPSLFEWEAETDILIQEFDD